MEKLKDKKSVVRKKSVTLKLINCIDCPFHEVQPDPDKNDWFNDDDVKVVCKKKKKNITVACRPYNTRKECEIPNWCPLVKK
jgi:hypothetical protein